MEGEEAAGTGAEGDGGAATRNALTDSTVHGSVVQAGHIQSLVLQAPPAPPPVPRQVPLPQHGFVNRSAELAALERLAGEPDGPAARVVVLSGLGGVGKTQLVAQWAWAAHQAAFPDGQLYADLADTRHEGAVDTGGVLYGFLRALGVEENRIGTSLAERAAAFRTRTAGMRMLVVIDNAQHPAEVRALRPASGLVVATSRRRLPGLAMDGAVPLAVEPLEAEAGAALFRDWLDTARADDPALDDLVRLCGGLPLALRAVGRRLLNRPHLSVPEVAAELADEGRRTARMSEDQDPWGDQDGSEQVDGILDAAYDSSAPPTRALYLLLGVFPGTTFSTELLAHTGPERHRDALGDLLASHLATAAGTGRHRLHDLVRAHARARAARELDEAARADHLRRFVAFYRTRAAAADRAVLGNRFRLAEPPADTGLFEGPAQALDWLDAERANLLAVLRAASAAGLHGDVWRLCESLWALYENRKYVADWVESHRLGVESAQWDGRPDAGVRLRNQLARAHMATGERERAAAELARAAELLPVVDDPRLAGMIRETEGLLRLAEGGTAEAVRLFGLSREANAATGDAHGVIIQSYHLGQALARDGRPAEARDVLLGALASAVRTQDDSTRSRLGIVLGQVHQALGAPREAARHTLNAAYWAARSNQPGKLRQALTLLRELAGEGDPDGAGPLVTADRIDALRDMLRGPVE